MKSLKSLLALLFAFALVASACGGSDDPAEDATTDDNTEEAAEESSDDSEEEAMDDEEPAEEEVDLTQGGDLTFHMITHSDDGPFWSVVKRGMEAACEDVGVSCVWQGSVNDANVQAEMIDAAVAQGTNGLAVSLPNVDAVRSGIEAAVAAGIPVYTINSGVNDYQGLGATTHVGQTEVIAGEGAGAFFNEAGATKILCGRQEPDNGALIERCDGLANTFNGEVISEFMDLDADQVAQEAAINAALAADPDIDGFMGVGPVITMSGLRAADALGRDLAIGGFDMTPELLDAIEAGDIIFTVDQQQYLQGYIPIILMYLEVTNANTLGGGLPILTGPGFVTGDNVTAVKELSAAGTR